MRPLAVLTADCIKEGFYKKICGRYAGKKKRGRNT